MSAVDMIRHAVRRTANAYAELLLMYASALSSPRMPRRASRVASRARGCCALRASRAPCRAAASQRAYDESSRHRRRMPCAPPHAAAAGHARQPRQRFTRATLTPRARRYDIYYCHMLLLCAHNAAAAAVTPAIFQPRCRHAQRARCA